ncbi:BRK domain-containing protein [Phthorimaea operculella]|nr:BRK domain-containing protein [Phthorimaea operculella]
MCKRQCGLSVGEAELPTRADLKAEPIGEERAIATLERIDLLRVLREEVAPHAALEARLALCERSADAPPWWQPANHDKLLVRAVCKHGLGDTYNKIFCDPKLPFADCARKYYSIQKPAPKTDTSKASSDDDESISETRMSLRTRSKRGGERGAQDRDDDDTDALSELETLAKLGRVEESLSAEHWFSERALETRLHHIAHAVQNCEWPAAPPATASAPAAAASATQPATSRHDDKKRHIAIDVETERAKLHALLSSPAAAHAATREPARADDSNSDRSTPAPPPAHQRVAPSPAPSTPASAAPVDLSAPLDLSEAQDFSMGRRTPQPADTSASAASAAPRSRLDDTLSRLMKRKNVAPPEQVVGKEKKRKKLDEIRIAGHKAPQLKHLAQWIAENPMYDIDSKWTEGIKEHVKLPQDVRGQRHSPMQPAQHAQPERKKGRPPSLDAAAASVLSSGAHLNQGMAGLNPALLASLSSLSAFDPKTLAATLSNLTGFDPKLLNTFDPKLLSSLSSFDPKNNPLLSSFGSMPNLLGNLTGGNIFANLAGLGLPGFSGLDMNALGGASTSGDSKSKSSSSSSTKTGSASGSKSSNSQFPFVFPNPNMLYPQLGLGGLNPFGMHSGMSSAYDALGLLGNNLAASSAASMHAGASSRSGKTTAPRSSTVVTSSRAQKPTERERDRDRPQTSQLPQILLPPDPYLLESLSKQSLNYDALLRGEKRGREAESHDAAATDLSKVDKKKQPYDALRSQMPPEFAAVQEKLLKGDKKDIDISKMLLEQMASGALSASLVSSAEAKRSKDIEKDSYEKLSKSSSEYIARTLASEDNISLAHKRTHEEMTNEPENLAMQSGDMPAKKMKDISSSDNTDKQTAPPAAHTGEMDLEDLIAPSTVIKTGMKTSDFESNIPKMTSESPASSTPVNLEKEDKAQMISQSPYRDDDAAMQSNNDSCHGTESAKTDTENKNSVGGDDNPSNESGRRANKKKGRKASEETVNPGPRRELRSSSGRQSTETNPSTH